MHEEPPPSAVKPEPAPVSRSHFKGFSCGLAFYVLVWSLRATETTKLSLWLLLAAGVSWWYTVNGGRWIDLRWEMRKVLRLSALVLLGIVGLLIADAIITNPAPASAPSVSSWSIQRMVYVLVAVPFIEEVLFRGLLFDAIGSATAAVVVTAAADSLAHGIGRGDVMYALAVLPGSLVLGAIRAYTKGVAVPSVMHICINILAYGTS